MLVIFLLWLREVPFIVFAELLPTQAELRIPGIIYVGPKRMIHGGKLMMTKYH